MYKGIVRSHLDYGSQLMKPCPKQVLAKLDKMQYQALRIVTGCMRSTPTNVLLAECAEMALEYRRKWLASKFVLKIIAEQEHPISELLLELDSYCQSKRGYWTRREVPYIIEALEEVDQHANNIHAEKILPCFEIEHVHQITPIEVANINNDRAQINSNKEFLSIFGPKFEQHTWIFTDGSLDKNQGNVGLGVFIPSINHKFSARLPQLTQICTAEVIAINKAITICLERNLDKSVIFSDSKSALQKISSTEINKDRDHISLKTKRMLLEAEANGCEIKLAWIPGHSNIHGNLVADTLANIGRNSENQVEVELDKNDVLPTIKQQIQAKWKQEWKLSTNSRGFSYAQIIKEFPSSPWFTLFPYKDRRHLTTIIRMRTGHCLTNKHLHRIGILTHPYCECGQVGDLNHIILECPLNKNPNFDLYQELSKAGTQNPFSITTLIEKLNYQTISILLKFLNLCCVKL
ncbi:uncharacterized protein LOC108910148 [Anoplophora glabripennis]|uniref:uncharacterized protein LOC108910148 n=1 Tax=Anoplophora glabripennis TaxID=217634 RepID=UPI000C792C4D|nr:uncharacterized protein LOC108910148 [Anoplophora glabripennis]